MKLAITIVMLVEATALAEPVRHVPPAEAEAGQQVELVAEAPASTPTLVAHVRTRGAQRFTDIELVRKDTTNWVAVVPAAAVVAPGLDYYVTAGDAPVFATLEWPHSIAVRVPADQERRERDEVRNSRRRSKMQAMGEWVEFGKRTVNGVELADHYYRFDADFSYRLWSYPLEEIRVGYTRLLGDTQQAPNQMCTTAAVCTAEAGFKVGGWFELGLAAVEGVRFDARMLVIASQDGFAVGGRGEARLGDRDASHVALGVEYLAAVGTNGFFRLGWGTVPKLPMSATVEITNLPADHTKTGVRLYYDVAREVLPGLRLGIRVGYAARNQSVAGFTGGAGAAVEF